MGFDIKINNTWMPVKKPYVKNAGAWVPCTAVWLKVDGAWSKIWPATPPGPVVCHGTAQPLQVSRSYNSAALAGDAFCICFPGMYSNLADAYALIDNSHYILEPSIYQNQGQSSSNLGVSAGNSAFAIVYADYGQSIKPLMYTNTGAQLTLPLLSLNRYSVGVESTANNAYVLGGAYVDQWMEYVSNIVESYNDEGELKQEPPLPEAVHYNTLSGTSGKLGDDFITLCGNTDFTNPPAVSQIIVKYNNDGTTENIPPPFIMGQCKGGNTDGLHAVFPLVNMSVTPTVAAVMVYDVVTGWHELPPVALPDGNRINLRSMISFYFAEMACYTGGQRYDGTNYIPNIYTIGYTQDGNLVDLPPLNIGRYNGAAAGSNEKAFVVGGIITDGRDTNSVEFYSTEPIE